MPRIALLMIKSGDAQCVGPLLDFMHNGLFGLVEAFNHLIAIVVHSRTLHASRNN